MHPALYLILPHMGHPSQVFRAHTSPMLAIGLITWTLARIPSCPADLMTIAKAQLILHVQDFQTSRIMTFLLLNCITQFHHPTSKIHSAPTPHPLTTTTSSPVPSFTPKHASEQRARFPSPCPTVLSSLGIPNRQLSPHARSAVRPSLVSTT